MALSGEMKQGFSTAFRRWTLPVEGCDSQEGPIPGLRKVLTKAGLSCFCFSVEAWCQMNGAASLSELVDEVANICSVIGPPGSEGLAPELPSRLHKALSVEATSEGTINQEPIEIVAVHTTRKQMSIGDVKLSLPHIVAKCDRIHSAESNGHQDGLVPGLRNLFE